MTTPGQTPRIYKDTYRYAYNGMEQDQELKGNGNSYTTEFRQYDPRLGRWMSLDPLMMKYPDMSPYVAFNNNPVFFVDPFGLKGEPGAPVNKDGGGEVGEDGRVSKDGITSKTESTVTVRPSEWQLISASLEKNAQEGAQRRQNEAAKNTGGTYSCNTGKKIQSINNAPAKKSPEKYKVIPGTRQEITEGGPTLAGGAFVMGANSEFGPLVLLIGAYYIIDRVHNSHTIILQKIEPVDADNSEDDIEITINENDADHIFRDTEGHFPEDTQENRDELEKTANNDENYLGRDSRGNDWHARTRSDGSQVWTSSRNGRIRNGGVNTTPKKWDPTRGLNNPPKW